MFTRKHTSLMLTAAGIAAVSMHSSSTLAGPPVLEVLAYQGLDNAPPGFPGLYWNLSGGMGTPAIDNNGKVAFGGTIFGDGIIATNNRVVWYGDETGWSVVARSGNATLPGLPGLTYTSLNNSPYLSGNGLLMTGGVVAGGGITTANDTAMWYGPVVSSALYAQESTTTIPGGAVLTAALNAMSVGNSFAANEAGQVLLYSALSGGDVSGTLNNAGLFMLTSSGATTVWRKGDPMPGAPALPAPDGPFMTPDAFGLRMNSVGEIMHGGTLVAGTAGGVTTNDDKVIVTTVGGTMRIVAREGFPVEDFPTLMIKPATFFNLPISAINTSGKVLFNATLADVPPGATVTAANDTVWLVDDHGAMSMAVREGDLIDGETFNFAQTGATLLNNNNQLAIAGAVTGTTNTGRLWTGPVGGPYTTIVKQGVTLVPGTTDAFLDFSPSSAQIAFNNSDQMVFGCNLVGPGVEAGVNDRGVFGWSADTGLVMIARNGVTVLPELLDLSQFIVNGSSGVTGNGGSNVLTDNGWFVMRLQDVKGFQAIVRTQPFLDVCTADIDGSGAVDINDLLEVINNWGACANPNNCPPDIDGDDQININDLLEVINTWGDCP